MRQVRTRSRAETPPHRAAVALAALLVFGALAMQADAARSDAPSLGPAGPRVGVVVREGSPRSMRAERLVARVGGRVTRQLPIVGGFAARLPAAALLELRRSASVAAVWRDGRVAMADDDERDDDESDDEDDDGVRAGGDGADDGADDDDVGLTQYDGLPVSTVWRDAVGLRAVERLYDGEDVTVAVLDTGVTRTYDLDVRARVEFTPGNDGVDRFGHGTHIAGIVAGDGGSDRRWRGVAPDAGLVSVKVAAADGATDVSVVLAGLQWVVANKERYGIRVLNLSFGTDATSSYLADPLNYAVQRVWRSGILVVAAAGNRGPDAGSISKPGDDPFVLTVGAADVRETAAREDDQVAPFSSRGPTVDGIAKPDLVAPGISIVSIRARDSWADLSRPAARVGSSHFKGSGTSQAAAVVSGIAALLFDADPSLTPDEAKAALVGTSSGLAGQEGAGRGLVDAAGALAAVRANTFGAAAVNAPYLAGHGEGSIEASRGTQHVYSDPDRDGVPQVVTGEVDVLGNAWDARAWASAPWSRVDWEASPWRPLVAELRSSSTASRLPKWSGMVWDAAAWSAKYWSDSAWVAKYWSGKYWSTHLWN